MKAHATRPHWGELAGLAVLLVAIWLPRGLSLDRLVTPDEKRWLTKSASFYQALASGDLSQTYQIEYPGVTTMWIGTAAFLWRFPDYPSRGPGQVVWWREEVGPSLLALGVEPLEMLAAGRVVIVLAVTLALAAAFWAARGLFGFWPAFLGFLFIAADPFHIAHARLLHVDGLLSSLLMLALLLFLNALYRGRRRVDLLVSGAAAGLAWLTKSPALLLIPYAGLLVFFDLGVRWRTAGRLETGAWRQAALALFLWGLAGAAVYALLWPAMWADPAGTLERVARGTVGYALRPHEEPLYFDGVITNGDPGLHFYPVTFLWRATPFMLAGLGFAAAALALPRWGLFRPEQRRPAAALLLFMAVFTLFMSLGSKKFDRYLLPVFLPAGLLAGLGWTAGAGWLRRRLPGRLALAAALALLLPVLAGQAAGALSAFPYYLSYYNPLLGGAPAAPKVMMVGWGEGLDQAASYLNSRPGPPRVMIGVWGGTFSYFYKGEIRNSAFTPGSGTLQDWLSSDYCVVYISQWQRGQLPQELLDYLAGLPPAMVVRLQGLAYVYVFDIRGHPPPEYLYEELDREGHEGGAQNTK